jgi:hypothetical protein
VKLDNIVFIAEFQHYKNWAEKNYYDLITFVRDNNKNYNITIFWTDENPDYIREQIKIINPILILYFETDRIMDDRFYFIFDLNIKTAVALLDMFYPNKTSSNYGIKKANALIHFSNNKYIEKKYKTLFPDKYIGCFCSRFINTCKFKDYKKSKKYDVLIYGVRNHLYDISQDNLESTENYVEIYKKYHKIHNNEINFYFLRQRLEDVLIKNSHKYKLHILTEKTIFNAVVANEDLSMLINESYLTVSCRTISDILMHKFIEIAASKSVILGNIPTGYEDIFKGNIIEIDEFMSDEEIIDIIDKSLDDKKKLEDMTNNLYKIVQ